MFNFLVKTIHKSYSFNHVKIAILYLYNKIFEASMFNLYTKEQNKLQTKISTNKYINEKDCVDNLIQMVDISNEIDDSAKELARNLVKNVRSIRVRGNGVDALMQEFKLSSLEGIALMCLSESLLRIPDKETQDKLIKDKITKGKWQEHVKTENTFVNAASWGLLITGKLVNPAKTETLGTIILKLIAKGGEPLIRRGMETVVRIMGKQFVMGETIEVALKKARKKEKCGYKFSYDMLGEAAMNETDAKKYMQSYINALNAVGKYAQNAGIHDSPGISVKLSAIHPRYKRMKQTRVMEELYTRLKELYLIAETYQIGLFIDAEETDRLELSLDLLEKLVADPDFKDFKGIGFVIQAYQKRAPYVIDYVASLAKKYNNQIMVRLVKGAYWDSEIKLAQIEGSIDYPVFTRKFYTDLSYIACAQKLFTYQDEIYPLFATHNAYTLATIYELGKGKKYEFQCLFGMGETLYNKIVGKNNLNVSCRVYAPVGSYETLLAYLIRRLLENGANSSFIHQLVDKNVLIEDLLVNPIELAKQANGASNPYFNLPAKIYPDGRINSKGFDLSDEITLNLLNLELNKFKDKKYLAHPLIKGVSYNNHNTENVLNPANHDDIVGNLVRASSEDLDVAITNANNAFSTWSTTSPLIRAKTLLIMADKLEENYFELMNILMREAGKTYANAISEVREAVDFCRYYGMQVTNEFDNNTHKAIGVLGCISPWNFPLAIFLGEVSSALVSGNTVLAKPSIQTNIVAYFAVKLFHDSGVPIDVLQLILGSGGVLGEKMSLDNNVKGIIFTGSTEVAQGINQNLASKNFDSVLIAETGGQNAMIVDSSALPEQVVADVISSGFDSAGQRCSALRVLYIQSDIADKVINMLKGAMDELQIGNPCDLATDIGPVIDAKSQKTLLDHIEKMRLSARMFHQVKITDECTNGTFVSPTLIEIGSIKELSREVFGPVVHVIRFDNNEFDHVVNEINSSGYGLTQGLHSRIEENAIKVYENIRAGNIYVNRNTVGAVVGVQPFGGEGLSGTGPKAGGPLYLYRLVHAKITKLGGNVSRYYNFNALTNFINCLNNLDFSDDEINDLNDYAEMMQLYSPITTQINLPGPTGEKNFMFFAPKGTTGIFANNKLDYTKQIIAAFATGNKVILEDNVVSKIFTKLISNDLKIAKNIDSADINVALIANSYEDKDILRNKLAKRTGQLIVNVIENEDNLYDITLLMTERTVSINVTATGGNIDLMSLIDNPILN